MSDRRWTPAVAALMIGTGATTGATFVATTALGIQVYALTQRELDLGLLGLAQFAPAALLVLVTGSVIDRHDRGRVASASAGLCALAAAGLAAYALTDPTSAAPIFGLVVLFGSGRSFLMTAQRAVMPEVVPAVQMPWLVARRGAVTQAAIIAGPLVAGWTYEVGPVVPYVVMVVLLGITTVAMLVVRPLTTPPDTPMAPVEPGRRLHDAMEGARFIRRTPLILGAISLDLFAVLFGSSVALLPAIVEERLRGGAAELGVLHGAGGVGAMVVTLALTRWSLTRHVGPVLLASVAGFGAGTLVLGLTTSFAVALLAMFALHGADALGVYIRTALVPLVTPRNRRGRVAAVESVFIGASNELGALESGVTGELFGASGAVVLGGSVTLVVAGAYAVAVPSLRNFDRFPMALDD